MSDEPVFDEVTIEGRDGKSDADGDDAQAGNGSGEVASSGQGSGSGEQAGEGAPENGSGSAGGTGTYAGGTPGGSGTGSVLTPAEQVAILDAQLKKGTGDFDSMIVDEQQRQRDAARASAGKAGSRAQAAAQGTEARNPEYGGSTVASTGGYGGGSGGSVGPSAGGVPQNTAKYPPPADIPSGQDDDVVARQLREAAMREPDPAVREKLWDEYRKYKGIKK